MQMLLAQFSSIADEWIVEPGSLGNCMPEPIVIDLSEDAAHEGIRSFLHSTAEFLIISISGCAPKKVMV